MSDKKLYQQYLFKGTLRKYQKRLCGRLHLEWKTPSVYVGQPIVPLQQANTFMKERILSGEPFAAGRYGGTELRAFWRQDSPSPLSARQTDEIQNSMRDLSGFFPSEDWAIQRFAELMREASGQMDVLCVWFNLMEDYVIAAYGKPEMITTLPALEPWYVEHPWTAALAGKKVLVIHPFRETILRQYEKREQLFDNPEYLPEFADLNVIQAVQTIAGNRDERFEDWFQALDWMYSEALKTDFDVAILGCGAYGFPLAAKLKAAGKQAVHMGGATQLLFGIKGKRWDDQHPNIRRLYNDAWVRPAESEKPKGLGMVEGGCYW